jgi:hypothetical protein
MTSAEARPFGKKWWDSAKKDSAYHIQQYTETGRRFGTLFYYFHRLGIIIPAD